MHAMGLIRLLERYRMRISGKRHRLEVVNSFRPEPIIESSGIIEIPPGTKILGAVQVPPE
jgi:hypothetical protein